MEGEFLCKYCGAPLELEKAIGGVVRCVYCNNAQTLPKTDVSPAALSFLRMGEHDLDTCDFDKAYTAYAKAAELDKEEPEAYFGMALATFKVQFLKDEVNERMQPICHEISDGSILDDKNFRRALELATDEQKREYRKRGREIDEIKEEFYDLQRKGLDYDCFLCVKVTEEDGRTRTADYDRANDIYYYLKDEGYKPFFSEREMKGRTGADYEALILYALYRSECMLIVCSDESYLKTKWVKNEYTRFLHMLANEEKERDAISFAFYGTPVEKLPSGKKVQGIDLSKPDAYSRIGNFVEVHTPEAKKKREEEKAKKQQKEAEKIARKEATLRAYTEAEREWKRRKEEEARLEDERRAREAEERKKREEEEKRRVALHEFEIENGVLKKYKGQGGAVTIPDGVTLIGERAFYGCSGLISMIIPHGVTLIRAGAFYNCSGLTSISISDSVTTIEGVAFEGCNGLKSITIPDGVASIGGWAFNGCSGLTSVTIPKRFKGFMNKGLQNIFGENYKKIKFTFTE